MIELPPDAPPPPDDCDPDPPIRPGAPEIPGDHWDNDCDGMVDEILVCAQGPAQFRTIGEAIAAAPRWGAIEVCPGIYAERLVIEDKPLLIRAPAGAERTILDATSGGPALIIRGTASTGVTFEGFTIRNGKTGDHGAGVRCESSRVQLRDSIVTGNTASAGGGLFASGCALEVARVRFENNSGGPRGGGAALVQSSGVIADSAFHNNRAVAGAGIYSEEGSVALRHNEVRFNVAALQGGGLYHASDAPIEVTTVVDNESAWTGGGIFILNHAPVLRQNSVIRNKSVNDGGGFYIHMSKAQLIENRISENAAGDDGGGVRIFTSQVRLERNNIMNNTAADGGGGVRISHDHCELIDNVIRDNTATDGGGIDMDNDSSVVRGGTIAHNRASRGGGIHGWLFPWRGATIENVRFLENHGNHGGAIYFVDNFQSVVVRGSRFERNTAILGGGIWVSTTEMSLSNSVFIGNAASQSGGAIHVAAADAWADPETGEPLPCPCPPEVWTARLGFSVFYDNAAPDGGALWTDAPSSVSVTNSILLANREAVVTVVGPSAPEWRYNDTFPPSFVGMPPQTGELGNLSVDPGFVDALGGDFRLTSTSACLDAGDPSLTDRNMSRADMGLYGGPGAP